MGKIIDNSQHLNATIQTYISKATTEYSTLLNSSPLFCTYYSKNHLESSYDKSIENFNELIGADSPIKFNKIDNFPLYKMDNASFSTEITDFGISGNITSTAIILPNTVKPLPDDVFTIQYLDQMKIFRVIDIEQDNYNNNKFYKITFNLAPSSLLDVENQVNEEFTVDYNLIGNSNNPVISVNNFQKKVKLEEFIDSLIMLYRQEFLDPDQNILVYNANPVDNYVDFMVNNFIISNDILSLFKDYRKALYVNKSLIRDSVNLKVYKNTLYYKIENLAHIDKTSMLNTYNIITTKNTDKYSLNWFGKKNYFIIDYVINGSLSIFSNEFIDSTEDSSAINSDFEKIVFDLLFDDVYDISKDDDFDLMLDTLTNIYYDLYVENSTISYFITPVIIYVLKQMHNSL
jgi:hypothetical protein